MTEPSITSSPTTEPASANSNNPQPGIRPLLMRISLLWLMIFFADIWLDLLGNAIDLSIDGITTLFDLVMQFEGYLATEFVAGMFDLTRHKAEIATFYGLLPLKLLLIAYLGLRLFRWLKRLPAALKTWKLKEKILIVDSWQQLQWYWKLSIIVALLASSQLLL